MEYLPIIRAARRRPLAVCDWHNIESDLMSQYATPSDLRRAKFMRKDSATDERI